MDLAGAFRTSRLDLAGFRLDLVGAFRKGAFRIRIWPVLSEVFSESGRCFQKVLSESGWVLSRIRLGFKPITKGKTKHFAKIPIQTRGAFRNLEVLSEIKR
mgnify:CR=1 FL=1